MKIHVQLAAYVDYMDRILSLHAKVETYSMQRSYGLTQCC